MSKKVKGERMTCEEQMNRWVAGESVHNAARNECCPDFSCCQPELLAPIEVRQKFAAATPDEQGRMCFKFLGAMLQKAGCEVVS